MVFTSRSIGEFDFCPAGLANHVALIHVRGGILWVRFQNSEPWSMVLYSLIIMEDLGATQRQREYGCHVGFDARKIRDELSHVLASWRHAFSVK